MERDFTHESYRMPLAALAAALCRFLDPGRIAARHEGAPHVVLRHGAAV